jgi:hypothetical protein
MGGFKYIFTYIYNNPFSYVIITMTLNTTRTLIMCFIFSIFLTLQKYIKNRTVKTFYQQSNSN